MKPTFRVCGIVLCGVFLQFLFLPATAQVSSDVDNQLTQIFEDAKSEFYIQINTLLRNSFRRSEVSAEDTSRVFEARNQIPNLFERLMIIAYQKYEPTYSHWIKKGDKKSLDKFRKKFIVLAKDYAGRFVGSLFRKSHIYDFEMSVPHNKGKSRLDLVLQTLGYNARNKAPDIPRKQWFTNKIESDYDTQWAIDAVMARHAHQVTKGSGVIVAVLDTGLDPYNSLFKDKTVPGFSFLQRTMPPWVDEQLSTIDWGAHGTAVTSTVLMLAPDCQIMPVRVGDGNTMNDPAMDYWLYELYAAGIYYAVNHGAQVINCSAPLPSTEPVLADAFRYAYRHNVIICAGAGNFPRAYFGIRPKDMMYKSFDNEVLLVGGVGKEDTRISPSFFSIPSEKVDVTAPAEEIFVIFPIYMQGMKNTHVAGTSLAAPIASGVVALMRSAAPPSEELLKQPGGYCRLVSRCIRNTARLDVLDLVEPNEVVGHGLLDAYAAVQMIQQELIAKK